MGRMHSREKARKSKKIVLMTLKIALEKKAKAEHKETLEGMEIDNLIVEEKELVIYHSKISRCGATLEEILMSCAGKLIASSPLSSGNGKGKNWKGRFKNSESVEVLVSQISKDFKPKKKNQASFGGVAQDDDDDVGKRLSTQTKQATMWRAILTSLVAEDYAHKYEQGDLLARGRGEVGLSTEEIQRKENQVYSAVGRLTLANALVYACKQGVDKVVDLATLTGAYVVALGNDIAGMFTPNDEII
eukprot:Gb_22535 [translate_table: standard]